MKAKPKLICGLDEAGRGALAGPVVAAAVVLKRGCRISGLADSKVLTAAERERLATVIQKRAIAWAVAEASPEEIRELNILRASLLAMRRAFQALGEHATEAAIITDGTFYPEGMPAGRAIVRADANVPAVSAASILAKVHRDALMVELGRKFPQFSFGRHKGYATPQHIRELEMHGPLEHHREGFAPVRNLSQMRIKL